MLIFASVNGRFLEPASPEMTVVDLVSHLQIEANSVVETQALRDLYHVLLRGGSIHLEYGPDGLTFDTQAIGAEREGVGKSTSEGAEATLAQGPDHAPVETVVPAPHQHLFQKSVGCISDAEDTWLQCACGNWCLFEARSPGTAPKKTAKNILM